MLPITITNTSPVHKESARSQRERGITKRVCNQYEIIERMRAAATPRNNIPSVHMAAHKGLIIKTQCAACKQILAGNTKRNQQIDGDDADADADEALCIRHPHQQQHHHGGGDGDGVCSTCAQ